MKDPDMPARRVRVPFLWNPYWYWSLRREPKMFSKCSPNVLRISHPIRSMA